MESVASRVDEDTKQWLEAEASKLGVTESEIVRRILTERAEAGDRVEGGASPVMKVRELERRANKLEDAITVMARGQEAIGDIEYPDWFEAEYLKTGNGDGGSRTLSRQELKREYGIDLE
jgi:hypothetical protein